MGPTVLLTHLKIILLQCFQFSISANKFYPKRPLKWMTQDVNESTQFVIDIRGSEKHSSITLHCIVMQLVDEKVAYVEALENANSISSVGTMCLGMIIMNYFSFLFFFLDFFIFPS